MPSIKVRSFAKINISLDIKGVREDGYHELETVMQRISLCDEITVKWTPAGGSKPHTGKDSNEGGQILIGLSCNKYFLPVDERNIAYKAAALMAAEYKVRAGAGRIDIYIEKHIPVAAGLAGGSGNGAAVLIALNKLWGLGLATRELCRIGAGLGADVPFCVLVQNTGFGCALCRGIGEELSPIKNKIKKAVLLVKPSFGVSTKEVYSAIDHCRILSRPDNQAIINALKQGDQQALYKNMANVLEDYTLLQYGDVKELKIKLMSETMAEAVMMTGSGPTVFALFSRLQDAQKACADFRKQGYSAFWAKMI